MTAMDKMNELMNDTAALELMMNAATPDALMDAFQANGIVLEGVSKEEAFEAVQKAKAGELGDEDLDEVAGGFSWNASGSVLTKFFNLEKSVENGKPTLTASKQIFGLAFSAHLHLINQKI